MADCQIENERVEDKKEQIEKRKKDCSEIASSGDIAAAKQCFASVGTLEQELGRLEAALRNCEADLPAPGTLNAQGLVTFLRVHDSAGFGPNNDFLDGEVVFKLDDQPDRKAFGFQLRDDNQGPAHEGMLSLLRDAFVNNLTVSVDYEQELNKFNSVAFRIMLIK